MKFERENRLFLANVTVHAVIAGEAVQQTSVAISHIASAVTEKFGANIRCFLRRKVAGFNLTNVIVGVKHFRFRCRFVTGSGGACVRKRRWCKQKQR